MTARLQATLDAVKTVRPPLERFYNSLSDEQKERFNELGPAKLRGNAEARAALPDRRQELRRGQARPHQSADRADRRSDQAERRSRTSCSTRLEDATAKAVATLQAACPNETPLTPPGRLEAMQNRLQAMIDAAKTVKPALDAFYASLSNEQKARFNRIGQQLAKSGG